MKNMYYEPGAFGLEIVGVLDAGESYEYDLLVLWRDDKGKLYWEAESGCSCPTPFEETSLRGASSGPWSEFEFYANAWLKERVDYLSPHRVIDMKATIKWLKERV